MFSSHFLNVPLKISPLCNPAKHRTKAAPPKSKDSLLKFPYKVGEYCVMK